MQSAHLALNLREALSFLPSSCFLPDGNSLPILLELLPLQHKHMSAQRQPEGLGRVDLTMGAALLQTLTWRGVSGSSEQDHLELFLPLVLGKGFIF